MRWAAALVVVAAAGDAAAQSTRYPPPAVDVDAEREQHSDFWENALEPGRDRYDDLVARAARLIGRRSDDARKSAAGLLEEAATLLPGRADAWAWLGLVREADGEHAPCRDALERAWTIDPTWKAAPRPIALALGVCRARAGDLEGSIDVLERLIARGDDTVEALWRLGEGYMALGRLEEARAVLEAALAQTPAQTGYVHAAWALVVAADRARDPEAVQAAAARALNFDRHAILVEAPPGGHVPASERDYYVALAADLAGQGERALLRFRRYLVAIEGDDEAPWASRAREHERALRGRAVADSVRVAGTDPLDAKQVRRAVGKADADLRACVAATPRLLLAVTITVHGPPPPPASTPPARPRPRPTRGAKTPTRKRPPYVVRRTYPMMPPPPAGVTVQTVERQDPPAGHDDAATRDAVACVDKVADRITITAPKTPGTWATATFHVIAE